MNPSSMAISPANSLFLRQRDGAEAILLKVGWAAMSRTNVVLSFFPRNRENPEVAGKSIGKIINELIQQMK